MTSSSQNSNSKPSVAIIGGGIAGLSCAQHLQSSGSYNPTVFDTGRLRPGGRCSSRYPNDKPKDRSQNQSSILSQYTIDHAAQILVVPGVRGDNDGFHSFQKQVDQWKEDGVIQQFPKNSVAEIVAKDPAGANANAANNKDKVAPLVRPIDSKNMYYCTDGFGSIPLNMATTNEIKIEQDVWISPSSGVKYVGTKTSPQWSVQTNGRKFGKFDHVIIAHNGKCADRLMSKTPAKDLHSLLKVDFRPTVPDWGGKKMTLNSIYSLTVALKMDGGGGENLSQVVGKDVITAFVKNEPNLKLITNQSNKLGSASTQRKEEGLEVWTILSSAKFAKKYKGPQENLPQERVEEVTTLMLAALERSLGLEEGTIHEGTVKDSRLQLWGAAVPLNVWSPTGTDINSNNSGFMYDAEHSVGACGDWLLDPSIAGAWESGRRLANWMSSGLEQDGTPIDAVSVGLPSLGGEFKQSTTAAGSGIGNVR